MNVELNEKVEALIKKQISDDRQIGLQVCAYQYGKKIVDTLAETMGTKMAPRINFGDKRKS